MTTFDDRLTRRLEGLDRAIPVPRQGPVELRSQAVLTMPTSSSRRRRLLVMLAAVVALLVAATVAIAQGSSAPEAPDATLDGALHHIFARSECIPVAVAKPAILASLDELGRLGWTIEERPGAAGAPCVAAIAFADSRTITLIPAAGEAVSKAMESVASDLLARCLDQRAATAYVASVLSGLGLPDVPVRIDPSAHTGPSVLIEQYERHVAAGCFVYAGYQHDSEGRPFVILWGHGAG